MQQQAVILIFTAELSNLKNHILFSAILLLATISLQSQTPSFYHLSTANGLYDNHVRSLAIDSSGFLWIGTEEGLNRYDGRTVQVFLKEKNAGLPSENITVLLADTNSRLWIGTNEGAAWMDKQKKIHRVILEDTLKKFFVKAIIATAKKGIIIITNTGHYSFSESANKWQLVAKASVIPIANITSIQSFPGDEAAFIKDSLVVIYNYATATITRQWVAKNAISLCILKDKNIAIGYSNGTVAIVDPISGKNIRSYSFQQTGKITVPRPSEIKQSKNGDLLIATDFSGFIVIQPSGTILHYIHEPGKITSLIANSTYRIATGSSGEVVIGTSTSGISMYNTELNQAVFNSFFSDANNKYYDNYTGKMLEASNNTIWVGAYDRLIKWERTTNQSVFYYYDTNNSNGIQRNDFTALCFDRNGKLWTGIENKGIASFTEKTGFDKLEINTTAAIAPTAFNEIIMDKEGTLWASTNKGLIFIDPLTRKTTSLSNHPVLSSIATVGMYSIFFDSKERIWMVTSAKGIYLFDKKNNSLKRFTTKEGLPSDICYMVREDKEGRFFIPGSKGMTIIHPNGTMVNYTKEKGLRYERCESVLIDNENNAWFSNKKCLVRWSSNSDTLEFFDEKAGLLNDGFRVGSCLKTNDGELLWGGYRGVSSFIPQAFKNTNSPLRMIIESVMIKDSVIDLSATQHIKAGYAENTITFYIAGIHLGIPGKTYYQFRLKGFDKDWQKAEDISHVRYTALPAGSYSFEIKASLDGVHWISAAREINITIVPPLWKRWWFIILATAIIISVFYFTWKARIKKIKQKEATQQKMADIEMQALRAQMNPHFIFNCLNSINRYIVKSDQATASLYLTRFAKLIRLILDNSGSKNILLSSELEALKLYIEMEALRFDKKFIHEIIIDKNVNTESIEVPPLLIQPYVENAIWHGLLHKEKEGQLNISLRMDEAGMLECIIDDNGVGRDRAAELKSKSATSRKSLGMQLTEKRLALLNYHTTLNASIQIIDKKNEKQEATGTRVIVRIPV